VRVNLAWTRSGITARSGTKAGIGIPGDAQ
jgi:hypothetical protein